MKNVIMVGNGKTLQLEDKELINLNIQINDISDISTRNSSYSNTINVPNNSHNQEIFEMLGMIGSTTRVPYQKVACKYFRDGVAIINSGYLQVTDITRDYFKVVMYDGIIDLGEALKDKTLGELTALAQFNHTLDEATYTSSFGNTTGYKYVIGDYGVESPVDSSPYALEYQPPSLFAHSIFDSIITEAGFTYEGSIFSDADYLSLLVAPSIGYVVDETPPVSTLLSTYDTDTISNNTSNATQFPFFADHDFTLNTLTNAGITLVGTDTLRVDFDGRLQLTIAPTEVLTHGQFYVYLKRNGATILTYHVFDGAAALPDTTLNLPVSINDTFTMNIFALSAQNGGTQTLNFSFSAALTFNQLVGGQSMDFNVLYGEDKQSDVLKDIMQHYGMIVVKDNNTANHLRFTTLEELLVDKANAEDWTTKLVGIKNQSFSVDGYGRNNEFLYKYDKEIEVFEYDGTMAIDNEHLSESKTLINSIFKIRNNNYTSFGNQPVYNIPLWEVKTIDGTDTNIPKKTELTLFKPTVITDTINFNVYGGLNDSYTGADVPLIGFVDVDYQYYVDNYYTQLKALLDNNKVISVVLNLNSIEVTQLDFFKLKYLKQTGKYYYLNSVKSKGGLVEAELVEINN